MTIRQKGTGVVNLAAALEKVRAPANKKETATPPGVKPLHVVAGCPWQVLKNKLGKKAKAEVRGAHASCTK